MLELFYFNDCSFHRFGDGLTDLHVTRPWAPPDLTVTDLVTSFAHALISKGIGLSNSALNKDPRETLALGGDMEKALNLFAQAMRVDNGCEWAHKFFYLTLRWKAEAWAELGEYEKAISSFNECLAIRPTDNDVKGQLHDTIYRRSQDRQDWAPPSPMYSPGSPIAGGQII